MASDMWDDMARLNALYEELCWNHTDQLTMRIEGNKIVISNPFQEQRDANVDVVSRPDSL